jgi:hypothetical protein
LTQRPVHGLSYNIGYTYSHSLDSASSNWNANPLPPDSYDPRLQYGNSDFDLRHRFTLGLTYNLPSRKSFGQLLEGWAVNSRVMLETGLPWSPQDTSDDFAGNGQVNELNSYGQPWDFFGNPNDFTSGPNPIPLYCTAASSNCAGGTTVAALPAACLGHPGTDLSYGCYLKGSSVLLAPTAGTLGTAGRNIFRDSGYKNWDFSVTKNWKFGERFGTQFRAEFFNILNHPTFTNPGGPAGAGFNDPSAAAQFGCGCNTPDQAAPDPVLGSGANRSIQLGLKLIW